MSHRQQPLNPTRPTVPDVLPLAIAYLDKDGNSSGGNLHIVLEENCIDDQSVTFCRDSAMQDNDFDGALLASKMLLMSKTGRGKIARLASKVLYEQWRKPK